MVLWVLGQFSVRTPADDCCGTYTLAVSDHGEIFSGERGWFPPIVRWGFIIDRMPCQPIITEVLIAGMKATDWGLDFV